MQAYRIRSVSSPPHACLTFLEHLRHGKTAVTALAATGDSYHVQGLALNFVICLERFLGERAGKGEGGLPPETDSQWPRLILGSGSGEAQQCEW